ncbi:hypothetical protein [uncultured Tateyamaria sp.]|uniref:hypothetical protein n=1 Tax=uncultured Tateyamaria sp. TaxID=455651 RepID=UPI00261BF294|nr:hypothetical protein [uncultured Tateyamaria sp.]
MTKILARPLTDMRPAFLTGLLLVAALLLTACVERRADRIAFDGVFFRSTAKKVDKQRDQIEVTVSPVSASLEGAREAGRFEAIRYCIENFGTSNIDWINGPDAEDGTLNISGDKLLLRGTCAPE